MENEETGIARAVKLAKGQGVLARRLQNRCTGERGISQQAVSGWVKQGFVPVDRAAEVSALVNGQVKPRELVRADLVALVEG